MGTLNDIPAGSSIYLDANICIYAIEDIAGWGATVRPLFERIDASEVRAITSELSLSEVLVRPIQASNIALRREYEAMLDPGGRIAVVPIARAILIRAAELRATMKLRLPDAIHAATALQSGCTTFLTNDARFEAIPALPVLLLSNLK